MEQQSHNSVVDLIATGIVRFAEQPPGNWRKLEAVPAYTVPLLAEDYPAKTAVMWNAVYNAFGMPDRNSMVVADPTQVGTILDAFRRDPKYRGGGCGIGFKEIVLHYLDEVEPLAQAMGAVNIIKKAADGRLIGANTDGRGYAEALEEKFRRRGETLAGKRVLLIGAGGSAKAIAVAIAQNGAQLLILNRTVPKAEKLAARVNAALGRRSASWGGLEKLAEYIADAEAVIAAVDAREPGFERYSALGMMEKSVTEASVERNHAEAAANLALANASLIVSDIRLRKQEIATLKQARELGFDTLDGIPMVVNQGIEAFWWLYGESLAPQGRTKEEVAAVMQQAAA